MALGKEFFYFFKTLPSVPLYGTRQNFFLKNYLPSANHYDTRQRKYFFLKISLQSAHHPGTRKEKSFFFENFCAECPTAELSAKIFFLKKFFAECLLPRHLAKLGNWPKLASFFQLCRVFLALRLAKAALPSVALGKVTITDLFFFEFLHSITTKIIFHINHIPSHLSHIHHIYLT
jgi:hypothetical protein